MALWMEEGQQHQLGSTGGHEELTRLMERTCPANTLPLAT